jgi:hypothetical protein
MRTQAHRIVDTDPKRGNSVVRVTGTRHDEPTYQVRQSLPNTQEVPWAVRWRSMLQRTARCAWT